VGSKLAGPLPSTSGVRVWTGEHAGAYDTAVSGDL
jgi:hypothetical protein